MNRKEIEQAVKGCLDNSKKRLLADKDFLQFLHYFPAGVSDEVKRYFNQVATGRENFFMVPDRADKQKAICSRCGKNIILPSDMRHKDRAACPKCAAQGEVVHGWRRQFTKTKYYFTYYQRALYDKEAIIARSFAVYRCVDAKTGTIAEDVVPREYYLMRKSGVEHWSHESDDFARDWWSKRRTLYNKDSVMRDCGYVVRSGQERLALLLADSWLKYSQLDAYMRLTNGGGDALKYIELYHKHPQLEYLMKMGLWNIIDEGLSKCSFNNLFDWRGQTPQKLLGVPAEQREDFIKDTHVEDISTRELQAEIKKLKRAKEAAEAKAEADHKLTRKTEEKLAKVSRQAEELGMQLADAAESKKITEALSSQRDALEAEAKELRKSLYNREQETAILEERIKELEEQLKQPVTVATKTEIVEKVPEKVAQELQELREKLAEAQSDTGAQKEALELKVEIWVILSGINKLLERLDKVQDGKRGAGVCRALASALTQRQNQITKRLAKFEQV